MVTFFKQSKKEQTSRDNFLAELERIATLSAEQQIVDVETPNTSEGEVLALIAKTFNAHVTTQKKLNTLIKTISKATNSGTFFCDVPSGNFMDESTTMIFSDEFREMIGYLSEEELPNNASSIMKFTPEHLHEKAGNDIAEGYAQKGDGFTMYSEGITKSGDLLLFDIKSIPFYDDKGTLKESIGVVIDITQRQRQLENIEHLALKSETINQLIEEAPWNADFSDEAAIAMGGRISYSPQFLKLLGYDQQTAQLPETSQAFIQSIHPEDQAYTTEMLGRVMERPNQTTDVHFRVKHRDGHYMRVRNRMHLITKEDGTPAQLIAVMRDMTLEEREKEKAAHMRAQIDNLSSGISEILDGVHSITMQAQDLAKAQESSVKAADEAQKSAESTREISALIRGIAEEINLLGLNAAIESARAGEHGKGFAVVADQVRKLAISSSDATGDIEVSLEEMKQLIIVILRHMDQISELISTQAALTQEVNASVDEINELGKQLVKIAEQ